MAGFSTSSISHNIEQTRFRSKMPGKEEMEVKGKRGNNRKSGWPSQNKPNMSLGITGDKNFSGSSIPSNVFKSGSYRSQKTPTTEALHAQNKGFNSSEVSAYLNREWKSALDRANDSAYQAKNKPEIYKMTDNEWMTKSGSITSVWAGRGHLTVKGTTFLSELRKSVLSSLSNNITEPKGG
ncbi:uncharacterized protein T551_00527 [Pneumocystis jirovecii RU7]|uniref:Uncharacterized protein n=1 Tax=Pneumocystis jirovecii (strain RU7) TaxID=1408657 RepID=A0A0W4ZVN5_PNEJ7|nr:uncharacterized protein T551_00527 [Pneumocystis jirovecii RU7]KTW32437.1 hypothetical protein T551_00527 [Pneumocystis jirovecii RU7]